MILLLSCFDLAVVTIVHPVQILSTIFLFLGDYNYRFEEIRASLCLLLNGFSMFALSALSLERFLALTYPIFHRALVTKGKLLIYLAFFIISLVGLFPLMYHNRTIGGIVISVYLFLFLILFAYLNYKMSLVVKSKQKEEKSECNSVGRKTRKLNFKNVSTCFLAVLCFFICSCPYIIYSCLGFSYMANTPYRQRLSHHIWSNTFVSMNSTFNCLIFFWRNSILYREGMKIVKCFRTGESWMFSSIDQLLPEHRTWTNAFAKLAAQVLLVNNRSYYAQQKDSKYKVSQQTFYYRNYNCLNVSIYKF